MDEARVATIEDLPGIIDLAEHVFADSAHRPRFLTRMFPVFLSAANVDNLYVVADGRRIVSLLGTDLRTLVTAGCRIPVVLVGAVCTHEEYAGRHLSGQTLQLAYQRCQGRGAVLALISGWRTVYKASGAEHVWDLYRFGAKAGQLPPPEAACDLDPIEPDRLEEVVALHNREPMRFEWPPQWVREVFAETIRRKNGRGFLLRRGGRPVAAAWFSTLNQDPPDKGDLLDWFGDRDAIVSSLGAMAKAAGFSAVHGSLVGHDREMMRELRQAGLAPARIRGWTLKVLDFAALLDCLRPHLARTLGGESGAVQAEDNGIVVAAGSERYASLDEWTAVQMIFAPPADYAEKTATMPAVIRAVVEKAFPVPIPHYGLNYI